MTRVNFLTTFKRVFKANILVLTLLFSSTINAGTDTLSFWSKAPELKKNRRNLVLFSEGVAGVGIMSGLAAAWYSNYSTERFHFFDDSPEWMGMDKIGHGITAYYIASYTAELCSWAGMNRRSQNLTGVAYSLGFLSVVEVLDGFSSGWGFSITDMLTNVGGVGLFYLNRSVLKDEPVQLKYNSLPSPYRQYRPELLGADWLESLIKDYNGQTYWLSFNLHSLLSDRLPNWLALGAGYGVAGLLGGKENPLLNEAGQTLPRFDRYAQFYLSPDIQWDKIKTRYPFLKGVFKALTFVKLPLPGLELNGKGQLNWNWLI